MRNFFRKVLQAIRVMFCRHSFIRAGFCQKEENGVRYSARHYKCQKCGKMVYADSRNDKYAKNAITPCKYKYEIVQ